MLSKRILGILKQYPNPEVAFFATEVLLGNWRSSYLTQDCVRREKRGRRVRFYTHYVSTRDDYTYGRTYSQEVPADAPFDMRERRCIGAWGHVSATGRERLAEDMREAGTDLATLTRQCATDGTWYNDDQVNQQVPTEILSTWVAAWVNRWLKGFASVQTVQDFWEHWRSIYVLTKDIRELADYVEQNRVDPGRLTLNQLLYRSNRWHAALARANKAQDRREMAKLAPPSDRVFDDGVYSVFRLDAGEALAHEGKIMTHCVATYSSRVRGGECEIYSVRDPANLSYATLEVRGGEVRQIKGIRNAAITDPELCQVIANFIAHAGFVNRTGSCQLPVAPLEVEPGGEDEVPGGLGWYLGGYTYADLYRRSR